MKPTQENKMPAVLVGCGGMANTWVRLALDHPQVALVGLVDLHRPAALAMAGRHGLDASQVFDSLADAVEATGARAVFNVTIPRAHHAVTLEALQLGCHVLSEKPLAETLEQGRDLVAAATAADRLLCVTQTRRPVGFSRRSQAAVEQGLIGEVQELHCDFYRGHRFGMPGKTDFRNHMAHPLLLDMAVHTFDNARQISGADPKRVYCRSWNPGRSWYEGDASACAIFDMVTPDGRPVVYTYRGSWTTEGFDTSWNAQWRIVGAKGTLRCDGEDQLEAELIDTAVEEASRPITKVSGPEDAGDLEGHAWFVDRFAAAVLEGAQPPCPASDNLKSLAMVLAAVESAETGVAVDICL